MTAIYTRIKVIRSRVKRFAKGHGLSQGYTAASLVAEQSRLDEERGNQDGLRKRFLSPMAISVILKSEKYGVYTDRVHATEPPFMAPSADPEQYSKVCLQPRRLAAAGTHHDPVVLALSEPSRYHGPLR